MSPAKKAGNAQSDAVKGILRKHLGRRVKGRQILAAFEEDPGQNSDILINYIREQLPKDKYDALIEEISQATGGKASQAQINNIITGGKIDQLINIGRLDSLTIEKKISPFRDVKQLLVFLAIFLFMAGGIYAATWYARQPRIMKGNFNIAVAQFGEITDNGIQLTELSTEISDSLQKYLDSTFKSIEFGTKIETSNKNMPLVTEAKEAENLAGKIHADIVIYGSVYRLGNEAKFTPRFYISKRFDTNELTGETKLERPITVTINTISDQDKVEQELKTRSAILINFTKSLIYLSDDKLDEAIEAAKESIGIADTMDEKFVGQENLPLLAAQIELARNDFDSANQYLDQVVQINPDYARAYIGRGNLYYGQATLSKPYDNDLLDKAMTEYQKALQAKDQPKFAYVPVKAHRSMGNIYFIKAQNENSDGEQFANAIEQYKFVVEAYEKTKDPAIREMAALSYFSMGIAYERLGNLQEAIQAYENAIKTTEDQTFKETVNHQLDITKQSISSP